MPLDPRQLQAFATTVAEGSLSRAAPVLGLTLAATSLRVKALEEQLGQRLLVRGKVARATPAGQKLLAHVQQLRLMENDLLQSLAPGRSQWQQLAVAVNADSLASWFLPGLQESLQRHQLTLDVLVDDQEHTLQWLQNGDVMGCVTSFSTQLRGCVAEPLGRMRYHCVAAPALAAQVLAPAPQSKAPEPTAKALLKTPAIAFNRKDSLQDQFLAKLLGLAQPQYPRHYLPATDAYHLALERGLGWGMQASIQSADALARGALQVLFPEVYVDVPLYWQHWQREAPQAARLTQAVKAAAQQVLLAPV
jgi:LysR family transcriptional regulator, chromosome initiation inhibitor